MPADPLGFARIHHQFNDGNVNYETSHALFITGTPTQSDLDTLCAFLSSTWESNMQGYRTGINRYTNGRLEYSDGTSTLEGTSTVGNGGTASGSSNPASVAICCSIRIAGHYRGGHPRMYVGGIPVSAISSTTHFSGTFVGDVETSFAAYLAAVAAHTATNITSVAVGAVHRVHNGTRLSPPTFAPYVGSRVESRICSQRRRLGPL